MLDVIHFFLEEDMRVSSAEQFDAINQTRNSIYNSMYKVPYVYYSQSASSGGSSGRRYVSSGSSSFDDLPPEFSTSARPTKPYVPPTDFNPDSYLPFGDALDAPFN